MAIGDNNNDLIMLRYAGTAAAMATATSRYARRRASSPPPTPPTASPPRPGSYRPVDTRQERLRLGQERRRTGGFGRGRDGLTRRRAALPSATIRRIVAAMLDLPLIHPDTLRAEPCRARLAGGCCDPRRGRGGDANAKEGPYAMTKTRRSGRSSVTCWRQRLQRPPGRDRTVCVLRSGTRTGRGAGYRHRRTAHLRQPGTGSRYAPIAASRHRCCEGVHTRTDRSPRRGLPVRAGTVRVVDQRRASRRAVLDPALTDYGVRLRDVTRHLWYGRNVVGVMLGDGWAAA